MRKLVVLLVAVLFLSGCALTTIKPYKKPQREPEPAKKRGLIESIIKPKPVEKAAPAPAVREEEEDIK